MCQRASTCISVLRELQTPQSSGEAAEDRLWLAENRPPGSSVCTAACTGSPAQPCVCPRSGFPASVSLTFPSPPKLSPEHFPLPRPCLATPARFWPCTPPCIQSTTGHTPPGPWPNDPHSSLPLEASFSCPSLSNNLCLFHWVPLGWRST